MTSKFKYKAINKTRYGSFVRRPLLGAGPDKIFPEPEKDNVEHEKSRLLHKS